MKKVLDEDTHLYFSFLLALPFIVSWEVAFNSAWVIGTKTVALM